MGSNVSSSFGFGFGARYMLDQTMKFYGQGLPVFLRMQPVDETFSDVADIGFTVTVTGAASVSGGYTDYQIIPQPIVNVLGSKRVGVPETQLQFGPIRFQISQTWVLSMVQQFGYLDPQQVFRARTVVGIFFAGLVHSIENISDRHAGGQIIGWDVIAVRPEVPE